MKILQDPLNIDAYSEGKENRDQCQSGYKVKTTWWGWGCGDSNGGYYITCEEGYVG